MIIFFEWNLFSDSTINALIGPETDFHFVFIVSPVSSSLDLKRTLFTLSLRSLMSDDLSMVISRTRDDPEPFRSV